MEVARTESEDTRVRRGACMAIKMEDEDGMAWWLQCEEKCDYKA